MFWLIKKELTANSRYLLIGFAIFVAYAFIFSVNGAGLFMLCLTIGVYSLFSTNLVVDERYKIDLLMTTLPIRRRDMVLGKHLLLLVLFVASVALYLVLFAATRAAGFERIPPLTFSAAAMGLFASSVYTGVTLPLAYRFGAQSTRYVALALFILVFALSGMVPEGALNVARAGLTEGQIGAGFLAGALAVNAASFFAANAVFARKDL